jgi:ABC-type transport system involved in multi-copper enzyme maturation permease subunit
LRVVLQLIGSILASLALVYVSISYGTFAEMDIENGIKGTVLGNPSPLIRNAGNGIYDSRFYYGDYGLYVGMMATVFIATLATGITALYLKFKTEHAR